MPEIKLTKLLLIEPSEKVKVFWASFYFFLLLASYFVLRPIRDEMGVANGAANMQWLFSGTFLAMLGIVPIFGILTNRFKVSFVLQFSYLFFISNILLFFVFVIQGWLQNFLPIIFFIWLSVFNLFAVSLFWSLMVDIFPTNASKRLFGIIAVGGSLGAIAGPAFTQGMLSAFGYESLFLLAALLLVFVYVALNKLLKIQHQKMTKVVLSEVRFRGNSTRPVGQSVWDGIKLVTRSPFLKKLVLFMLLYTSVSTFLYFEQAHILEATYTDSLARLRYFSQIDLITNSLAVSGQLLLTNRIMRKVGIAISLCGIPILVGMGFIALSIENSLYIIAFLMILHRAGNFVILRPGREILYTNCNRAEKYRAKNFIDTAVYRGGDALTGWAFSGLASLGMGLSAIALIGVPLAIVWSYIGFQLGKKVDGVSNKFVPFKRS